MDWAIIIKELGGGVSAVVIVVLAWDRWRVQQRADSRVDELTDRLIDQSNKHVEDALRRERETLTTLQMLKAAIEGSTS